MFGRILGDQSIKDIRGLSPLLSPNSSPALLIPTSSTRESVFEKMPGQSFDLNPGCSAPLCEGINGRVAGICVWACRIAGCSVDKNRAGSSIPHQREPEHPCNRKGLNPSKSRNPPLPCSHTRQKSRESIQRQNIQFDPKSIGLERRLLREGRWGGRFRGKLML